MDGEFEERMKAVGLTVKCRPRAEKGRKNPTPYRIETGDDPVDLTRAELIQFAEWLQGFLIQTAGKTR